MNLSESLARYSVQSFADFLSEDMGMSTMSTGEKPDGGVGPGREVTNSAAGRPQVGNASLADLFPCIAAGNCDGNDIQNFNANYFNEFGGAGLTQILAAYGDGGGAGTPIDGGADAAGPAVGGGARPTAGTPLRGGRPDAAIRRRRSGGGGGGGIGTP